MRNYLLIMGLILSWQSLFANELLTQNVQKILQTNCLDRNQTAVSIISIPDGKSVFHYNAETPLLPASTMKIVTTAAALHHLGPEFRFHTQILHTGQRLGNMIQGDLVLRGGGDPKLTYENLWRIVVQLKDSGINSISGNLIYDTSFFDELDRAPAWDEIRSQRAYDAKLCALSLNFNTINIHVAPTSPGQAARVWLEPAPEYIHIINETRTTSGRNNSISARRSEDESGRTYIRVLGRLWQNSDTRTIRLNVLDPPRYAASSFRALLQQAGIELLGETIYTNTSIRAKLLYTHSSEPLSLILKELNTYSNNFVAEQIIKTMAAKKYGSPGSHNHGLQLVADFLRDSGIHTRGLILADGSGLSRRNSFTTRAMTDLLAVVYPRFDIGPDFLASLRVMGADGAHSSRLASSEARGQVRAKTGTLNKVSTLAGYVPSQTGELYAYAFFLNNNSCGPNTAKKIEDNLVNAIYNYAGSSMYNLSSTRVTK
jgi:serine-type D-Ala-D-Ala carboxypeptidase/endopeptidase (penicillin-binding protein 4)